MRKNSLIGIVTLSSVVLSLCPHTAEGRSKLNLRDRQGIDLLQRDVRSGIATRSDSMESVVMLVTVKTGTTADEIAVEGIRVIEHIGDAFIVELPLDRVDTFLANDRIKAAQFDHSDEPDMLYARMEGNANVNNAQTDPQGSLGHAFLGDGVVCGVFDIGFDVNHVDFLNNDDRRKTRVKKLVVFKGSSPNPEIDTEDEAEIKSFTTDKNDAKHGTHVLGIMAGSYRGPGSWNDVDFGPDSLRFGLVNTSNLPGHNPDGTKPVPYYGVAPKADIVICGNRDGLYGGAQLVGARRVIEYSKKVGKPCVINYSLGSQWGPRDGSHPEDVILSTLAQEAIICKSAGNDGTCNDYFSEYFTTSSGSLATLLRFPPNDENKKGELEFWLNDSRSVRVDLIAFGSYYDPEEYDDVTKEFVLASFGGPIVDSEGNPTTVSITPNDVEGQLAGVFEGRFNISAEVMAQNNRYCVEVSFDNGFRVKNAAIDGNVMTMQLGLRFYGDSGQRIDGNCCGDWVKFAENKPGYVNPSPCLSISNGSCAANIIAVGSYSNRSAMRYLDGKVWRETYPDKGAGDIAPSSGYGVLYDGRSLPQIATPGVNIVSASSRFYNSDVNAVAVADYDSKKYYFCEMSGTSMSCPLFAGICALWLEADPTLGYDDIMEVLEKTSRTDSYTREVPGRFGFGKADAYEGLKYVLNRKSTGGVHPMDVDDDKILVNRVSDTVYEVTIGDDSEFEVELVSLSGGIAGRFSGKGTVAVSTAGCVNGIYVMNVRNAKFTKGYKLRI